MKANSINWTPVILAVIFILFFVIDLGPLAGTSYRFIFFLLLLGTSACLFFYWTLRAIKIRDRLLLLKLIALPFLMVLIHIGIHYHRIKLDGIKVELGTLILGENSGYPSGFTHKAFRELKVGMRKEKVIESLGKPIWEVPESNSDGSLSDTITYYYFRNDYGTHHRVRIVEVHADTVVSFRHSFYFD